MSRINIGDQLKTILVNLSEGNPGAATVCIQLIKEAQKIDPDNIQDAFGPLVLLDIFELYAEKIWMLYKDVCGEDLVKTMAVLRGLQMSIVNKLDFYIALNDRGRGLDVDAVLKEVQKQLPNFGK